jgi:4-diphosphocytidyl-2-C-methyl-D-erythritol kinase
LTKRKKKITLHNSIANLDSAVSLLLNDFEDVVMPEYPEIKKIKENLLKAGAAGSLLCGSGSSVFGVFSAEEDAEKALAMLPCQSGHKTFTVHSI